MKKEPKHISEIIREYWIEREKNGTVMLEISISNLLDDLELVLNSKQPLYYKNNVITDVMLFVNTNLATLERYANSKNKRMYYLAVERLVSLIFSVKHNK